MVNYNGDRPIADLINSCYTTHMKRYTIKLEVELELDAYTIEDARDIADESIRDIEGLGVDVTEVTIASAREV